jgi:membrane fusion protein (multidrug efflux system)
VLAAWAAYWVMVLSLRECTDDAYVSGNRLVISAQVSGTVIAVLADDTQLVKAGQVLVKPCSRSTSKIRRRPGRNTSLT